MADRLDLFCGSRVGVSSHLEDGPRVFGWAQCCRFGLRPACLDEVDGETPGDAVGDALCIGVPGTEARDARTTSSPHSAVPTVMRVR